MSDRMKCLDRDIVMVLKLFLLLLFKKNDFHHDHLKVLLNPVKTF